MIRAFHFASVSMQLTRRGLNFFSNGFAKNFKANLKSNRDLLNRITIVQIDSLKCALIATGICPSLQQNINYETSHTITVRKIDVRLLALSDIVRKVQTG